MTRRGAHFVCGKAYDLRGERILTTRERDQIARGGLVIQSEAEAIGALAIPAHVARPRPKGCEHCYLLLRDFCECKKNLSRGA